MSPPPSTVSQIQSVARAVQLLKQLAASDQPTTVPVLAAACGLQRTTAWRLISTLEDEGLVERVPGGFQVGYGTVAIAAGVLEHDRTVARLLHPVLEGLMAATGESAGLCLVKGARTVVVDEVDPPAALSVNWVGKDFPLHTSSPGKVLLASLPVSELETFLERPLARLTPRTVTDPTRLRRELQRVRTRGFAASDEEFETGCVGISVAVPGSGRLPTEILAVTGPSVRLPRKRHAGIVATLQAAAGVAAGILGYAGGLPTRSGRRSAGAERGFTGPRAPSSSSAGGIPRPA